MSKQKFFLSGALLLAVALAPLAIGGQPAMPTLQCVYSGNWSSGNSNGPIRWNITQEDDCCGMWGLILNGSGSDRYGNFRLEGTCGEGQCVVNQNYTSGQLNGRSYTYTGDIQWKVPMDTMQGFSGSYRENNGSNQGRFSITSIKCK